MDKIKVFGVYAPCTVVSKQSGRIYDVIGLDYQRGFVVCKQAGKGEVHMYPDSIQLLLTPLEQISDEDVNKLWELVELNEDFGHNPDYPNENRMEYLMQGLYESKFDIYQSEIIVDYLRSRYYNLPYMGMDLVENGIAVLTTK